MGARETVPTDAPLDVAHRLAQEIAALARPDPHVLVFGFDPVDLPQRDDDRTSGEGTTMTESPDGEGSARRRRVNRAIVAPKRSALTGFRR